MSTRALACGICATIAIAAAPLASSASTAAGSWTATASMSTARSSVTATPLADGRVLVVGGVLERISELYDPANGTWIPGGTLNEARWLHVAVRLRDGRVFVAGGAYTASAELYDPATNRWTPTGSMSVDRHSFTATALRDGRVLVVGGQSGNGTGVQASAELYHPASGWTSTEASDSPPRPHGDAAGRRHGLGRGGFVPGEPWYVRSAELYDPVRGRWRRITPMTAAREHARARLCSTMVVCSSPAGGTCSERQASPPSSTTRPRAGGLDGRDGRLLGP